MKDDPEKWDVYRITVPARSLVLVREKDQWYFSSHQGGGQIPVDNASAERMAAVWAHTHQEEDWIDRHSLQFRWLRFWYRRKHGKRS